MIPVTSLWTWPRQKKNTLAIYMNYICLFMLFDYISQNS